MIEEELVKDMLKEDIRIDRKEKMMYIADQIEPTDTMLFLIQLGWKFQYEIR